MWMGFQDDRAFTELPDRNAWLDRAALANATIIRTTVIWAKVAPTRPAKPGDHTDPAYDWAAVDELVRSADARNIKVLMTLLGTPPWANRGKSQNFAPRKANMFKQFAKAVATRYSGNAGLPEVRHFTINNEPNAARFLMPQFRNNGRKSVGPAIYVNKWVLPGSQGHQGRKPRREDRHWRHLAAGAQEEPQPRVPDSTSRPSSCGASRRPAGVAARVLRLRITRTR